MQNRFADAVPQDPAKVPEYLQELADAMANHTTDVTQELARILNAKHAPLMIPRVTIDLASSAFTIVAAAYTNIKLPNMATTTSATLVTALNYPGRGTLQQLIVAEKDSGGAAANAIALKITLDGNVLYTGNILTTQSTLCCAVGSLVYRTTADVEIHDCSVGLSFNNSLKLEYSTAAGTASIAWKLAKKL